MSVLLIAGSPSERSRTAALLEATGSRLEGRGAQVVRAFLSAASTEEIIFVRGATEAINLVAKTWGWQNVGEGDEIIVSNLEHHANIVPWQQLAAAKGAKLRVIPVDDTGQVVLSEYAKLLNPRTKIVSVTQVSNALGTVTPVQEIVAMAHAAGAVALVDGAQSVSHMRVNMQEIGAAFLSSLATKCSARRASVWSIAAAPCSSRCRRGKAGAT